MDRLYHLNIKQEEDDEQKEASINNSQQNNEGHDASSCQLSVRAPKHVKKEEDQDGIVKQVQPCIKVKKEEEGDGECIKLEWDGDECDCEECRVDRQIKVEFNQNNATDNQQQANSPGPSSETEKGIPSQSSVCKRVKKEEDGELIGQWDEDCDCDDCRRMRLKTIQLIQSNDMENRGAGGDDGEETEIDDDGYGNEDVLVGNDENMAVDDQIGDEDGDELDQEGEQSGDGPERSEIDQMSDADDETEIDDEEYEMEVAGEESQTVRQSARQLKRKRTAEEIATECTTNPTQPNLVQQNRHFQCSHCHKTFDYNSTLQQHLRVHTGERPFQCDKCDKRFSTESNLTNHQLIHQNIKRFRCYQCGKQFTRKYTFESHQRTHSGERPFKCNFCERSFAQLNTRNTHERAIHLHVKPYRCKQCGHTATQRANIITHIRMVHFGLPLTIKQQQKLNIIDHRDPRDLIEKV